MLPRARAKKWVTLGAIGGLGLWYWLGSSSKLEKLDREEVLEGIYKDASDLSPLLPKDKIPGYTIDDFRYVLSEKGVIQWRIRAKKAFVYREENLTHAKSAVVEIEGGDSGPTVIRGNHAKYEFNKRYLEILGEVEALFPDGFVMRSNYMRYQSEGQLFSVPVDFTVKGTSTSQSHSKDDGVDISFVSQGMRFSRDSEKVFLPKDVELTMTRSRQQKKHAGIPEKTVIVSDTCEMDRTTNIADFQMSNRRPSSERYVVINEPSTRVKSRSAQLRYRNFSEAPRYMVARDDVTVRDLREGMEDRYATCGRADFDSENNIVILTVLPQVYQENDTVTGEKIIMHRDSDIVEVTQSNAYSQGQTK